MKSCVWRFIVWAIQQIVGDFYISILKRYLEWKLPICIVGIGELLTNIDKSHLLVVLMYGNRVPFTLSRFTLYWSNIWAVCIMDNGCRESTANRRKLPFALNLWDELTSSNLEPRIASARSRVGQSTKKYQQNHCFSVMYERWKSSLEYFFTNYRNVGINNYCSV